MFTDKVDFYGVFTVESFNKNGELIDTYTDKNLIMNLARKNMAELVSGVDAVGSYFGSPINRLVLGTRGYIGTDITNNIQVGETDVTLGTFDATRTQLFSEELNDLNYHISFNPSGINDVTDSAAVGTMYTGTTAGAVDATFNTVRRYTSGTGGNVVTYEVTVPVECGNVTGQVVTYTEAALYAGDEIFSMKTFPSRNKEGTVLLKLTWNIIF